MSVNICNSEPRKFNVFVIPGALDVEMLVEYIKESKNHIFTLLNM